VIDLSVNISEKIKKTLPTKILYECHDECVENMGKILFEELKSIAANKISKKRKSNFESKTLKARTCRTYF